MIDMQAVKTGDFVEFSTLLAGVEVGVFIGSIPAIPDTYEVSVGGNIQNRLVHASKFIDHQPA